MKCSAGLQHAFTAGLIDVLRASESKGDFAFQVISHLPPPKRGESTARNPPGVCKKSPSPGGRCFGRKIRRRKRKITWGRPSAFAPILLLGAAWPCWLSRGLGLVCWVQPPLCLICKTQADQTRGSAHPGTRSGVQGVIWGWRRDILEVS